MKTCEMSEVSNIKSIDRSKTAVNNFFKILQIKEKTSA